MSRPELKKHMIRTIRTLAFHTPSLSVGMTFFTLSLLFGSWLGRLPEVQLALSLSEGQLGFALLGLPVGALIMMPLSGWLGRRLSTGQAMTFSTLLFCSLFPLPAFAQGAWGLFFLLSLVGLSNSFMNISMNAAAAAVEREYSVAIMSACHGMFSLGAMLGAGSSGLIASMGVPLQAHLIGVSILMVGLHFYFRAAIRHLPAQPSGPVKKQAFEWPSGALLGLAFIGFCIMIGEGAVADWGAIYLRQDLGADPFLASMGYAGFSLSMAMGRFAGDSLSLALGNRRVIIGGSLIGALGVLLAILADVPILAIVGFTVVGIGFSSVVPLLFGAASRVPTGSVGGNIATVATSGVIGFLIAPPLIGMVSEHFGLRSGLLIVLCLAVAAGVVAFRSTATARS